MSARARSGLLVAIAAALTAPSASGAGKAPITKDQCIDANLQAQDLRRDGKFSAARGKLQACSDAACPGVLRDNCVQRLAELERAQPTIVFDARDGDGHDIVDVHVTMDGLPFTDRLDGKALPVDPGAHTFQFTVAGNPVVMENLVIKEGEKDRVERVVLGPPPKSSASAATASHPGGGPEDWEEAHGPGWTAEQKIGVGLAGAGVVGLGVGAVFGLMTTSAWSHAKDACGGDTTRCLDVPSASSYKDTATSDATLSTIGFAAGGALLVGGAVLFVLGRHPHDSGSASLSVTPSLGPGQGGVAVHGSF